MIEAQNLVPYRKSTADQKWPGCWRPGTTPGSRVNVRNYIDTAVIDGYKLPNHTSLISSGKNATTPLIGNFLRYSFLNAPLATYEYNNGGWIPGFTNTDWGFLPDVTVPVDANLQNTVKGLALASINNKAFNLQQPFQAKAFTGEIRETLKFLRHPLQQTIKLLKQLDGLPRNAGRLLKNNPKELVKTGKRPIEELANSWLELRFAILPLLSDMTAVLGILEKEFHEVTELSTYRGKGGSTTSLVYTGFWGHDGSSQIRRTTEVHASCSLKVGFLQSLQSNIDGLQEYLTEDMTNISDIVLSGWEVTPFSFLVDYFVNVQDVLQGYTHDYSALIAWNSMSERITKTVSETVISTNNPGTHRKMVVRGNWPPMMKYEISQLKRSVASSLIPPLTISLPGSNVKLANMAALAISLLSNKIRS